MKKEILFEKLENCDSMSKEEVSLCTKELMRLCHKINNRQNDFIFMYFNFEDAWNIHSAVSRIMDICRAYKPDSEVGAMEWRPTTQFEKASEKLFSFFNLPF